MKKVLLLTILLILNFQVFSQIVHPTVRNASNPQCEILQIGLTDSMTFVFFKYSNTSPGISKLCVDENSGIKINTTGEKVEVVSCINIPVSPSFHFFDSLDQIHYYAIAYKAIPKSTKEIDILGGVSGLNFYGVSLQGQDFQPDSIDYLSLLEKTPVKEMGYFYKEGKIVQYYIYKGLVVAMHFIEDNSYGDHYAAYISVENYSNNRIDFFPEKIYSNFNNGKLQSTAYALSLEEYMRKVNMEQALNTFFVVLGETLAASGAGHSTTITNGDMKGSTTSNGICSGTFGDAHGYMSSNVRTYSRFSLNASSNTYDATAAYYASQNARNNIQNFINQQYQISDIINQGYLKTNTIFPNQRINGYVNFNYRTAENIEVVVPIKSEKFSFIWPFKDWQLLVPGPEKSKNEKLIDKVLNGKTYRKEEYSDFNEVIIGDMVTFSSEFGDDIYGIIEGKKGSSTIIILTYPSAGQALTLEKKFKTVKHIKY